MRNDGNGDASDSPPARGVPCDTLAVLFLFTLAVLFFKKAIFAASPVVLGSPILVDLTNQWYPWRLFGFGMVKQGIIPLWNPYCFCGNPFVANWYSGLFYPPNWIFCILPVHLALNYSFIIHVALCGVFTYAYMRVVIGDRLSSLFAAMTFMFSSPLILRIFAGHLSLVCAMAWFPLELLMAEIGLRTKNILYFTLCGVAFAAQVTAGYPQLVLYSGIMVALYLMSRVFMCVRDGGGIRELSTPAAGVVVALAIAIGLAAVQMLPALEFTAHSSRQAMTYREAAGGSFPPENLATMLVPDLFGDFISAPSRGRAFLWEGASYMGILPLVLALLALLYRRNRNTFIYAIMGAASFVLALGGYTPVLRFLYSYVPGFNIIRGNAKAIFLTAYCLAFLAGIGCRLLLDETRSSDKARTRYCLMVSVALILLLILGATYVASPHVRSYCENILIRCRSLFLLDGEQPPLRAGGVFFFTQSLKRQAFFIACALGAILLRVKWCVKRPLMWVIIVGLTLADLWGFLGRYIITSPVTSCWWPRDVVEFLKRDGSYYRVLRDIRVPVPGVNQNMNEHLFSFEGYEANVATWYSEFAVTFGITSESAEMIMGREDSSRMASLANIKYLILPPSAVAPNPNYILGYYNDYVKIFENRTVLPRAWIVHRYMVTGSLQIARELMRRQDYDPHTQVILDKDPEIAIPDASPGSSAEIVKYTPDEVVVKCRMGAPGILVLSDTYYPGWEATVDNIPAKILRANYAFRGVPLGKGTHEVRFSYEPASFRYGAAVSGATVVVIIVYYLIAFIRRKMHVQAAV